jgi:signal peptidase I
MELKLFLVGCVIFVLAMLMLCVKKNFKTLGSNFFFKIIYSWLDTFWTSLIGASLVMFFFIQAFKIPSGSMRDTFIEGDHIFVNKFIYGFHIPFSRSEKRCMAFKNLSRGDIVVFRCPHEALTPSEIGSGVKKDYVKRCVAIAGDVVRIENKKLFVNGVCVNSSYAVFNDVLIFKKNNLFASGEEYQKAWESGKFVSIPVGFIRDNFGPIVVPKGCYMMMGDNRDFSFDSRFWGPLSDKYIKGKALFLYWPIKRWRVL